MNKELKKVALEYMEKVNEAGQIILRGLNLKSKQEFLASRIKYPYHEFYLDGQLNKYSFHGVGCWFENDSLKIDWNFGPGDEWCGFDPWLFAEYIQDYHKELEEFHDGNKIKEEFMQAKSHGEMKGGTSNFYFSYRKKRRPRPKKNR